MHPIVLLLGGNLGNVKQTFIDAIALLEAKLGKTEVKSAVYITEAWGFTHKTSDFLNQVIVFKTIKNAFEILRILQNVEKKLGKLPSKKNNHYQDRLIDIDILFIGNKTIQETKLTIPHSGIAKRNFVLVPLAEIMPDFVHPVYKTTIKQLHNLCKDDCKVTKLNP